jgi:hypothetical protein
MACLQCAIKACSVTRATLINAVQSIAQHTVPSTEYVTLLVLSIHARTIRNFKITAGIFAGLARGRFPIGKGQRNARHPRHHPN